jgi:hypothetical protein
LTCRNCELFRELICRGEGEERRFFVLNQVPFLSLSFFGMGLVGLVTRTWWPILAYSFAGISFLGPVGMAALCRHCPHYARAGSRLCCIGPNPFPKLFPYSPRPLNGLERSIVVLFSLFLLSFPSLVQIYGTWFFFNRGAGFALLGMAGINMATTMAVLWFVYILTHHFCSRCVNFSCPLNSVSEETAKNYLEKNPAISAAWEKRSRMPERR